MTKPPETIYLQCYDEAGDLLDLIHDDVTWCIDRINERDAIYKLEPAPDALPCGHPRSAARGDVTQWCTMCEEEA